MSFFSLQPSQTVESNLSKFASAAPDLEHVGNSASYLDPSLNGGETLHSPFEDEATQAAQGMAGSTMMRPTGGDEAPSASTGFGGQYQSNVTGTKFRTPSANTRTTNAPTTQLSDDQISTLQTLGQVQTGLAAIPKSAVDFVKSSLKSDPRTAEYSDEEIDQFIQSLNDPSLYQTRGLLEGNQELYDALNQTGTEELDLGDTQLDSSWLNAYTTGTRPGDRTALDKFALGDVQSALGIGQAAVTGDPVAILASLNKAAPNVAKYITDNQFALKDVGSIANVAGGAYSLYRGINSNNPQQIASGLGQLLQGAGTSRIGLEVLSQLTGVSTQAITTAFGAVGGITGAFGLYQAIKSGDPIQAALSAASIYSALSTVAPSVFTPLTTLAASALTSVAPQLAAQLGVTVGAQTGATIGGTAISGVAAGVAPAVALLAIMVTQMISSEEEFAARGSGWWNNPIIGNLYDQTTRGIQSIHAISDELNKVGMQNVSTQDLMRVLGKMSDDIYPYYEKAQGGRGPVSGGQAAGSPGMMSEAEYTAAGEAAVRQMVDVVSELQRRGVTMEQLGTIQGNVHWGDTYLGGGVATVGGALAAPGAPSDPNVSPSSPGYAAITSGGWFSPETVNRITGGPIPTMLATIQPGAYDIPLDYSVANEELLSRLANAGMINAQAYQDFTSGGG